MSRVKIVATIGPATETERAIQALARAGEVLWRRGKPVDRDLGLVTAVDYPRSGNRMNLIETHYVADLRQSFRWTL